MEVLSEKDETFVVHVIAGDDVGVVAAVEVRVGDADRWHPALSASADGSSWTFVFTAPSIPSNIRCRAVDDSLNIGDEAKNAESQHQPEEEIEFVPDAQNSEEVEL